MRNLGDKVHHVMRVSGVHQMTEAIMKKTGKDCGCKKRQEQLNKFSNRVVDNLIGKKWVLNLNPLIPLIGHLYID